MAFSCGSSRPSRRRRGNCFDGGHGVTKDNKVVLPSGRVVEWHEWQLAVKLCKPRRWLYEPRWKAAVRRLDKREREASGERTAAVCAAVDMALHNDKHGLGKNTEAYRDRLGE